MGRKIIVLNSGGFDSVVLMHYLEFMGYDIVSLFFDYGQRNVVQERKCAKKVADKLKAEFLEITLPKMTWCEDNPLLNTDSQNQNQYIPMRNLVFLSYALSIAEERDIKFIYVGFVKDPEGKYFNDTSPEFLEKLNKIAQLSGVEIKAPFINLVKEDLAPYVRFFRITPDMFFSCNLPNGDRACGKCGDCLVIENIMEMIKNNTEQNYLEYGVDSKEFIESYLNQPIKVAKININNKCQFNCKHCLYNFSELKDTPLRGEEYVNLFKELQKIGVERIDFMGKEPLYNSEIFAILKAVKLFCPEIKSTIVTNGLNIKKYIKELETYKPYIVLSVDSFEELEIRPVNSHLVESIKLLVEREIPVQLSIDLHNKNYKDIDKIIEEGKKLGVKDFYIKTLMPLGENAKYTGSIELNKDQLIEFIENISNKDFGEDINVLLDLNLDAYSLLKGTSIMSTIVDNYLNFGVERYNNLNVSVEWYCARMSDYIYITNDGYVLSCGMQVSMKDYDKVAVGNIRKEPLEKIIKRGRERALKYILNTQCENCPLTSMFLKN